MMIRNKIRLCTKPSFTSLLLLIISFSPGSHLYADTFNVGPGRTYTDLQAVASQLNAGDVVEVDGDATYSGDVVFTQSGDPDNKITIRGIRINGRRPVISGGTNTVAFVTPSPYSGPGADHYIFELLCLLLPFSLAASANAADGDEYDVIIFKHCFPGSNVQPDTGDPNIASRTKSLENYKLQYRALRDLMDDYPDNRFIVWTLAPLHRLATNTKTARLARQFVDWVNHEWLTEDGQSHDNIFIFDFWGEAAENDSNPQNGQVNTLKYKYERDHYDDNNNSENIDSHPNQLANQTIGPIFAQFIVNTIEYSGSVDDPPDNDPPPDDPPDEGPDTADTSNEDSSSSSCFIFSMQQRLSHP